jgi:hypothetical protein
MILSKPLIEYTLRYVCKNCHKYTVVKLKTKRKEQREYCRRLECRRERMRNENRRTKPDYVSSKIKIISGRLCMYCQQDTGPNRDVCPKCHKSRSRSIVL